MADEKKESTNSRDSVKNTLIVSITLSLVASVLVGARTPSEIESNFRHMATDIPPAFWGALKEEGVLRDDAPVPRA